MSTKPCLGCGSTSSKRLIKGFCFNKCYGRHLSQSKPKIEVNCIECGPTYTKKMVKGLCQACYHRKDRAQRKTEYHCPQCNQIKITNITNGVCSACSSENTRKRDPSIDSRSYQKHRESIRAKQSIYDKENKNQRSHRETKRRVIKKSALLSWINEEEIKKIYENRPEGKEVDHIIPLVHPDICGLHVPWNLQYLDANDNAKKHNKFDGTSTNESWRSP